MQIWVAISVLLLKRVKLDSGVSRNEEIVINMSLYD